MRVVILLLLLVAVANAALLRSKADPVDDAATPADIKSEVAAQTDEGCDGVQCGHEPKMVERGHFAHNVYLNKLAAHKKEKGDTYHPALVPPGTFNGTLHKLLKEPLKNPLLERPNMVPPGHFAHVAKTEAELKALANGVQNLPAQQAGTCKILDKIVTMARFVYEVESNTADGIDKSGEAIVKLLDLMCPLVKSHYPDANKDMECAKLSQAVKKFYDPAFVGPLLTCPQAVRNLMAASTLQETVPFEKRSAEARRILAKYPDRIPVICEKAARSDLPDIDKKKFLVPGTMLCGEFKYIIHKHINQTSNSSIASDQTIYLFVNSTSPKTGALMSEVYDQYKADDSFLYITYSAENTLGSLE